MAAFVHLQIYKSGCQLTNIVNLILCGNVLIQRYVFDDQCQTKYFLNSLVQGPLPMWNTHGVIGRCNEELDFVSVGVMRVCVDLFSHANLAIIR